MNSMYEIIWWGLAYTLIFTEQNPQVHDGMVRFAEKEPIPSKAMKIEEGRQIDVMEAQNFGFCLLPDK